MSDLPEEADVVIVGGGFYGASLALFCRSVAGRVVLLEARGDLLTRASFVNQARIHTGFHYPRSFMTARRSLALHSRFMHDFRPAVVDDFTMLYAIARQGSKVPPQRFRRMFEAMGAPLRPAGPEATALFDPTRVSSVYRCDEYAFDANVLRDILLKRLKASGVEVHCDTPVRGIAPAGPGEAACVSLASGGTITAPVVFDATYGQLEPERASAAEAQRVKYEMTEIALIEPPSALSGYAITLMDGPFFSVMPFPARGAYSLTHVRYTPHASWLQGQPRPAAADAGTRQSHRLHMIRDGARYVPALAEARWRESLYEVKTTLLRNESDDGRPILLARAPDCPALWHVLGGKLDNVYDLFDALKARGGIFAAADTRHLTGARGGSA